MFKTGITPDRLSDSKLYEYVQDAFIGIIESEALDYLSTWNHVEPIDEYLNCIFPRAFIQRDSQKALQIVYDLDDVARSDIIRESLLPLYIYAMYQMICSYEEFQQDTGQTEYRLQCFAEILQRNDLIAIPDRQVS